MYVIYLNSGQAFNFTIAINSLDKYTYILQVVISYAENFRIIKMLIKIEETIY